MMEQQKTAKSYKIVYLWFNEWAALMQTCCCKLIVLGMREKAREREKKMYQSNIYKLLVHLLPWTIKPVIRVIIFRNLYLYII